MSQFQENGLKIEIIKFPEVGDHIGDIIEYEPTEGGFIQYEYIEEEVGDNRTNISEQEITTETVAWSGCVVEKTITIKLETDNIIRKQADQFICSNRDCKRLIPPFPTQNELDYHNETFHMEQILSNQCPVCNKLLATKYKLGVHMETRHIPKHFFCDHCGKVFKSKDNLRLHMSHHRKHFLVECKACHKSYKSMQSLRYHLRQHFEHYQCEECGKVFEHKKLLIGHVVAKHNQELMVQCRFCSRMFSRNDVKEAHERDIHKNGEIGSHFKCKDCDDAFDFRVDLMKHKLLNHYSGQIFTCEECGKIFKKHSLLKIHMNCHLEKTIKCSECEMMFTFTTGLAKHKKLGRCKGKPNKLHKREVTKEEIARIAKEQLWEITVNPSHKVDEMDLFSPMFEDSHEEVTIIKKTPGRKKKAVVVEMQSEIELLPYELGDIKMKREETEEKNAIEYQQQVITSSSGRIIKRKLPAIFQLQATSSKLINITKKTNVPFVCDHCGETVESKCRLISHLKDHMRMSKYQCNSCNEHFFNMSALRRHYTIKHPEMNPFKDKRHQCNLCPKRYSSDFLLNQHKLSHENRKLQKCSKCTFATNVAYDLKNHIKRIHNATRDYKCTVEDCEKAFKRRCDMENHLKSVHTTIKIYVKCPTCGVIVLEKGLQSHLINRHSEKASIKPFICKICGKAERYEKNLQRHYEAVHEPRDRGVIYTCSDCSETFYRRRDLKAHSFAHYEGEIFACPECGNKYKSRKELTNHQYTHRCKEWPCEICDAVFQTKSGRAKHMRKHLDCQEMRAEIYEESENIDID